MTDASPPAASPPDPLAAPLPRRAAVLLVCMPLLVAGVGYALHRAGVPLLPALALCLVLVTCATGG